MLLKFFRNTKAYVSIFLCLILLPMVTYATMIIDATRLQSSRVQVQSAGDLAINAAMSEYDKVLEDMYGLFANATSAEELRPAIRNYFEETISGKIYNGNQESGYAADFANKLTDVIMNAKFSTPEEAATYEKELTNFLKMTIDDAEGDNAGFTYEPVLNSAISNPYVMKAQIIDYMKYKGPVSVGSNMLKKIGALKDMKSQSEAVEQKVELTQKIAELGNPMKDAYYAINNPDNPDLKKGYNQFAEQYNTHYSPDQLQSMFDTIGSAMTDMQELYLKFNYMRVVDEKVQQEKQDNAETIGPSRDWIAALPDTGVESDATAASIKSKLETIWTKLDEDILKQSRYGTFMFGEITYDEETGKYTFPNFQFLQNENDIEYYATIGNLRKWQSIFNNYGASQYDQYESIVQDYCNFKMHWKQFDEFGTYMQYVSDVNSAYQAAVSDYEYQLTKECTTDEEKSNVLKEARKLVNGENSEYSLILEREQLLAKMNYALQNSEAKSLYEQHVTQAADRFRGFIEREGNKYKATIDNLYVPFYGVVSDLEERSQFAVDKLNDISEKVDGVSTKAQDTLNSINHNVEDDTARTELSSDIEALAKTVNKEDIEKLTVVLSGYHDRFLTMKLALENVTHLDNPMYTGLPDNYGFNEKYKTAANAVYETKIAVSREAVAENIENSLYQEFTNENGVTWKGIDTIRDYDFSIKSPFNIPAKTITGEPEEEIFYNVLKNTVEASPAEDTEDGSGSKNIEELRNNSSVDANGKPTSTPIPADGGTKAETPAPTESPIPADCVDGADAALTAAITEINPGTTGSYGTAQSASVPQGKDDASSSADQGNNALKAAGDMLEQITNLGNTIKNNVFLEEYFTEMYTCHTDKLLEPGKLKMLNGYTNDPKSKKFLNTATPWYGCETEYILWGDPNLNKNFETTRNTIFLLRFVINAIYAFTASDIQAMASSLATLLVGWTVVLVPVVQVCIILACAVAESALDVAELVDGKDVPLIKDQSTFRCSPSGAINTAIDFAVDKTLEYTEKQLNAGIDKLEEKAKEGVENCSNEIDEVVNEYMENTTENVKASLKTNITIPLITSITPALNSISANKENAETVLREAFDRGVESIRNTISGMDGMMKELTQALLDKVIEEKNRIVNELCQKVRDVTQLKDLSAGSVQNLIDSKVNGCVEAISGTINSKLDTVRNNVTVAITEKISQGTESVRDAVSSTLTDAGETLKSDAKDFVKENLTDIVDVKQNAKSPAARITMNYKEYCKLFVFIGLALPGNQEKMIKRASVLMQVNVQYAVQGGSIPVTSAGKKDFKMTQAYTLFHIHANMKMQTLLPWAVKVEEDETNMNTVIDLSHIGQNYINLNYNGVAGY